MNYELPKTVDLFFFERAAEFQTTDYFFNRPQDIDKLVAYLENFCVKYPSIQIIFSKYKPLKITVSANKQIKVASKQLVSRLSENVKEKIGYQDFFYF